MQKEKMVMVILKLLIRENRNVFSTNGVLYTVEVNQETQEALGHDIKLLEDLLMAANTKAVELASIADNLELNGDKIINFSHVNFGGVTTFNFRNLAQNVDYLHITNIGNSSLELILSLPQGMTITKLGVGRQIGYFTHKEI
jgi:nicotinate-nucleotide pyrophosphorylase